jgi:hypothetical protein
MLIRSIIVIIIFSFTFASSCNNFDSKKDKSSSKIEVVDDEGDGKIAEIEFVEDFADIGTVKHGEVIAYSFQFSNTGNKPLIVFNVIAGCGCTKTKVSNDILNPGDEAYLEVVFDSKGWHGSQYKSVTVVTNATQPNRTVTIKANVVP